jgi:hypothetical protein
MGVQLTASNDVFRWNLTASGQFSVKSMYLDLLDNPVGNLKKYIWKIKVPLKIRIFLWFLHKKVILTKDNLKKRNWQGCSKCCFCDHDETIQHLFFACPFAKILWRIIYLTFNIPAPMNVNNLFDNWLNGVSKKDKGYIRVGVCALLWVIWNVRNDFVFNKKKFPIFSVGHTYGCPLNPYVVLSSVKDVRRDMDVRSNRLAMVARDFYIRCGWRTDRQLT